MSDYIYIPSEVVDDDRSFSAFVARQLMQDNLDVLWSKSAGDLCTAPGTLDALVHSISSTDWENMTEDGLWLPLYPSRTPGTYRGFTVAVRAKGSYVGMELRAILSPALPVNGEAFGAVYDTQTLPTSYSWLTFDLTGPYFARSRSFVNEGPTSVPVVGLHFAVRRQAASAGEARIIEVRLEEEK